jgi:hypothetical protein
MVNSRRKGHQYERDIRIMLLPVFPDCERTQEGESLDRDGVDLKKTGALAFQCKRGRKYASASVLKEVKAPGKIPLVITRADNEESVVIMYAEDFMKIIQDIGVVYEGNLNE